VAVFALIGAAGLLGAAMPIAATFRFAFTLFGVVILWFTLFLYRRPPVAAAEFVRALGRFYSTTASRIFTAAFLFLLLNVALEASVKVARSLNRKASIQHFQQYGDRIYEVYAGLGLSRADVHTLLIECFQRPVLFSSFEQFKERPIRGRFVTVYPEGYRDSSNEAPWPPVQDHLNVFVFGGSTTFGYGVPDGQTIPAHLQRAITGSRPERKVVVYNFGAGFYFSSQERILFENLILRGVRPHVAVFIDGLNDLGHPDGNAYHTRTLERMMERRTVSRDFFLADPGGILENLPIRAPIERRLAFRRDAARGKDSGAKQPTSTGGESVLDRYLTNQRLIRAMAADFGVETVFVWQPIPAYAYDLRYDLFHDGISIAGSAEQRAAEAAYASMAARMQSGTAARDVLYLADIQKDRQTNFYVDEVHYTAEFSDEIARHVFDHMKSRNLLAAKDSEYARRQPARFDP
jgi:hypothetical protein